MTRNSRRRDEASCIDPMPPVPCIKVPMSSRKVLSAPSPLRVRMTSASVSREVQMPGGTTAMGMMRLTTDERCTARASPRRKTRTYIVPGSARAELGMSSRSPTLSSATFLSAPLGSTTNAATTSRSRAPEKTGYNEVPSAPAATTRAHASNTGASNPARSRTTSKVGRSLPSTSSMAKGTPPSMPTARPRSLSAGSDSIACSIASLAAACDPTAPCPITSTVTRMHPAPTWTFAPGGEEWSNACSSVLTSDVVRSSMCISMNFIVISGFFPLAAAVAL
mmetsp:Transcript_40571/g.129382  ORF Transcript_40571/g.129382 Transcript_40571/m.129382 type:complete len:279 (+) Transcript_40571:1340-2176(+)